MALDLSSINEFPYYKKIAGAATTATEIKLPQTADKIVIANWHATTDLYIGQNGQTDGAAWAAADTFPVPAKNGKPVILTKGLGRANSVFVAAATGTIDVYIELTRVG